MTKTALVTGASSGIGEATALALRQAGFTVFGTSRNPDKHDVPFEMVQLDVHDDASVAACVKHVKDRTERIDVLVNNAGYGIYGAVEETSIEEAKAQLETNFFGVVRMTKAVLPIMREQRAGRVINIGSLAGLVAVPYHAYYSASKFALEGFTEALRIELEPFNVFATILEFGYVNTPFADSTTLPEAPLTAYDEPRNKLVEASKKLLANGIEPEKVARAVVSVVNADKPPLRKRVGSTWILEVFKRILPYDLFKLGLRQNFNL
jgi:short-subunit dehydrogenase